MFLKHFLLLAMIKTTKEKVVCLILVVGNINKNCWKYSFLAEPTLDLKLKKYIEIKDDMYTTEIHRFYKIPDNANNDN